MFEFLKSTKNRKLGLELNETGNPYPSGLTTSASLPTGSSSDAAPALQILACDSEALGRIRASVRALDVPPPHLFRALLFSAQERLYTEKTALLREAAEIKRQSDAVMMCILLSGKPNTTAPVKPLSILERLHSEE